MLPNALTPIGQSAQTAEQHSDRALSSAPPAAMRKTARRTSILTHGYNSWSERTSTVITEALRQESATPNQMGLTVRTRPSSAFKHAKSRSEILAPEKFLYWGRSDRWDRNPIHRAQCAEVGLERDLEDMLRRGRAVSPWSTRRKYHNRIHNRIDRVPFAQTPRFK